MTFLLANWAVFAMIVWTIGSLMNKTINHGKTRTLHWFWSFVLTIIQAILLACGGFFTIWGWPQWVYTILSTVGFAVFIKEDGEYKETISAYTYLFAHTIMWIIYFSGGFWFH
jgi:hypothetical protein